MLRQAIELYTDEEQQSHACQRGVAAPASKTDLEAQLSRMRKGVQFQRGKGTLRPSRGSMCKESTSGKTVQS
eukprot:2674324-Amphidinium_carterae.1